VNDCGQIVSTCPGQTCSGGQCISSCTPGYYCSGNNSYYENSSCNSTLNQTCGANQTCSVASPYCINTSCANGLNISQYPSCTCPANQHQSGSTCVANCTPSTSYHCSGTQVLDNNCNTVHDDCANYGASCGGAGVCSCPASYSSQSVTGATTGGWVFGGGDAGKTYLYAPASGYSYLPMAAVHAGLISSGQNATVNINSAGMVSSFTGSTANGVSSFSYPSQACGVTLSTAPTYSCTGSLGGDKCSGSDTGLSANTPWTQVSSCDGGKCEYTPYACTGSIPGGGTKCSGSDTGLSGDVGWSQAAGNSCASGGKCKYTVTYACTGGPLPGNATVCSGEDTGLSANTAYSPVSTPSNCTSGAKCQYYLNCSASNYCAPTNLCATGSSGPYACTQDAYCNVSSGGSAHLRLHQRRVQSSSRSGAQLLRDSASDAEERRGAGGVDHDEHLFVLGERIQW